MVIVTSWQQIFIYSLIVFLAGAAVPVIILRGVASDGEDNCFLTVVLLGMGALALLAASAFIYLYNVR